MELFFSPFACSLASHIAAREAGIPLKMTAVTLSTKTTADGRDYLAISPKGQVPALKRDDGTLLTEGPAVMQYLADLGAPGSLLPPSGDPERYSVIEWMNFVSTEIHKLCFYPTFSPDAPAEAKQWARAKLEDRLGTVEARLAGREFLASGAFSLADAYLTWALVICSKIGVDFSGRPATAAYLARMQARPSVSAALAAEQAAASPPA